MRRWTALVVVGLVGCGVLPTIGGPPEGMTLVVGGISDTRPYFGTYTLGASAGSEAISAGDFMLASCGCGDWRVLFRPNDGSAQRQVTVSFYSEGQYQPTGPVTVWGENGDERLLATVDQDAGTVSGLDGGFLAQRSFSAARASAHDQEVDACGLCHLGDDPIWPLPPQHPQKYRENPRVCFECHTVNGQ